MSILLFRIDDRLIHGQVLMGWGRQLRSERYLVVDDDLAASDWEQELYTLTVEDGLEVLFATVAEARSHLGEWMTQPVRSVLLTRDPEQMARLAEGGLLDGVEVNVGGLHHRPGRQQVRPYIHLDDSDREALRTLASEGARVSGRDLPDALRVPLDQMLA
ncbi:MAG TPA: PTS sugar transporter subunit IIB [Longimicrobiales bacterium]|nr:PTS sugar transporter subunit IIB [Longimicrobiales bacterium]